MSLLKNIKPNKGRTKSHPTDEEKSIIKALMNKGYRNQDILQIINHGRKDTLNSGRLSDSISESTIPVSNEELNHYLLVQDNYNNLTGLNKFLKTDIRLIKAREAMLSAIMNYNNPLIIFKEEIFCTLSVIAWTHLLHEKLEQTKKGSSKRKGNTYKNITITDIIRSNQNTRTICPIKNMDIIDNLRDIIKLRDDVEHDILSFGNYIANSLVPLFQSCCINFDKLLTDWFGEDLTLTHHISLALQFSRISNEQLSEIEKSSLPAGIASIIDKINSDSINNAYALKIHFTSEVTNKTNADIHKLIDHSDDQNAKKYAIKKVNTLEQYPYSYTNIYEKIKKVLPVVTKPLINAFIRNSKLKYDEEYSYFQFHKKEHRQNYERNKNEFKSNSTLPKNCTSIYNDKAIQYIIQNIQKQD